MKKHYVRFHSPGTFVAEETIKEIAAWDTNRAIKMLNKIKERHGATPYAFQFFTKERKPREFEPKITEESGMYYVNCEVQTLKELKKLNNPDEKILRQNMETNGWDKIVKTTKGWAWTQPLRENDVVL